MGVFIYVALLFLFLISSLSRSNTLLKLSIFLCFLFSSSAMGFGYDWLNYKLVFNDFYTGVSSQFYIVYEPAFSFLMYFVGSLSLSFQWVVIFSHLVCFFFLYKYAVTFERAGFIFFCCYAFFGLALLNEQLRQAVALSIFLFATTKSGSKFYLYLFFAMMFHYSAVFGFIFIFVKKYLAGPRPFLQLFITCFLSQFFITAFIEALTSSYILSSLPLFISMKITQYVESGAFGESGFSLGLLINAFLVLYCLIIRCGDSRSAWRNGAIFYSVFAIQSKVVFLIYRFNYYFLPFLFVTFHSYLIACIREKKTLNILSLLLIVFVYGLKPLFSPLYFDYLVDYESYWLSSKSFEQREEDVCIRLLKIDNNLDYCKRRY